VKPHFSTSPKTAGKKPAEPKVVIVEDQRLVAELFAFHCHSLGLHVAQVARTVSEGLAAIRKHRPELVLLDISLPDGDGLELAKTVLGELPEIKILAISSHCDPWTMLQVQRYGLHGFVDKNDQRRVPRSGAIPRPSSGCSPSTRPGFFR
jgi:DNA-binding NarL/FixJ family response regulator